MASTTNRLLIVTLWFAGIAVFLTGSDAHAQTAWYQSQEVRHPNPLTRRFGTLLAFDGEYFVARRDDRGGNPPTASLYRRVDGQFHLQQDFVGEPVSFAGQYDIQNGNVFLGAPNWNNGYVFIFNRDGTNQTLSESDSPYMDINEFGRAQQVNGDRLIVGAPSTRLGSRNAAGVAFIYHRVGLTWTFEERLVPDNGSQFALFGQAVSIDGSLAVVGAPRAESGFPGGAAYVYSLTEAGWGQQAQLFRYDPAEFDWFGYAVAVRASTIFVSSIYDIHDGLIDAGAVYVFTQTGGTWVQSQKLTASEDRDGLQFGTTLAASGSVLVVGTYNGGHAFVFRETNGVWAEEALLRASPEQPSDEFGTYVDVANDVIVIAAPSRDDTDTDQGAVFVFEPSSDCNQNGFPDVEDIATGRSQDCNSNDVPDECDIAADPSLDCNDNGVPDSCDLAGGGADCNGNGRLDSCDIGAGTAADVNHNGVPDDCECIGDITGDDVVGLDDLATLLSNFGATGGSSYADGDIDADGDVDLSDLAAILGNFGLRC